jgi:hypothetical protein
MTPNLSRAKWRKSVRSASNGDCVEVANVDTATAVRDSKNPHGPRLVFTSDEWCAFVEQTKTGSFDL